MKLHHYALIFIALSLLTVFFMYQTTYVNHKTMVEDQNAEFEVTASLLDAMNDAMRLSEDGTYLFDTSKKRWNAYDKFFSTLSMNLQHYATKDTYIKDYIPCVFMVDTDGFYVMYREDVNGIYETNISPINAWTESVNNGAIVLRYYLNDYVEVTNRSVHGNELSLYKGTVEDVYNSLSPSLRSHLVDYLGSFDAYKEKRGVYIAKRMEEETNYYVNKYNVDSDYIYDLDIPHDLYLQYGRQIDRPCMFALLQGDYFGMVGTDANIFAYANSEVIDDAIFKMTKTNTDAYYHSLDCNTSDAVYGYGSQKECAKQGFYPHLCVR